ncbi:MAG: DUF3014 domain-containing protein [Candidatus Aminicenantes bacterium]|jgi:hypothetical protein
MEENKKVILAVVAFFVLLAVVIALYFLVLKKKPEEPVEPLQVEQQIAPAEGPEEEEVQTPEPLQVDLDQSDETVRDLAAELSSHSALSQWLKSDDLVRNFVAAVDNIANGETPRSHIEFFEPSGRFDVVVRDGIVFIDPASYKRYNLVADVFSSLSAKAAVRLFWLLKPTLQEAYRELGYPDRDFQKTIVQSMTELLEVPVLDKDIEVAKDVISYKMVDPRLESLNPAQKHLLRMGPENVEIIQAKLRELAKELGVPDSQLPQKF